MEAWEIAPAELEGSAPAEAPLRRVVRRQPHRVRRDPGSHQQPLRRDDVVHFAHAEMLHPLAPRMHAVPSVIARLTPFSGLDMLVQLGDALDLITPQLESPERLRQTHRLPCRADVFATRPDVPWEVIISAVAANVPEPRPVTPLTPVLADRLGLEPYLQAPQPVVCLTVIEDPTGTEAEWTPLPPTPPAAPHVAVDAATLRTAGRGERTRRGRGGRRRRRAIREARKALRRRRSLLGRLSAWLRSRQIRKQRRRWFARIRNLPLHQQLWSVRPGPDLLLDPTCRRWVRDAFALAGADPRRMLLEWEIHWRQAAD